MFKMANYYYIYIMTNNNNSVLYTGVTNNLKRRVHEHQEGYGSALTMKYKIHKLVYFEQTEDVKVAVMREKQIKGGSRRKKIELINQMNPSWENLAESI